MLEHREQYIPLEKRVIDEIKVQHASSSKYFYNDESQASIIDKYEVEVVSIDAKYLSKGSEGSQIVLDDSIVSPEQFVARHLASLT